ncbi:MAG TPA: Ig-like domain-containing protein, partial [Myxococcaceae bacterium]|nr:Ig-like domain-containing protein [Myxococcaceae bacterium]
ATSDAFDINPAPAASYQLALPASVTAGQEVTLSATAYDAYGNLASAYAGAAKVTASDSVAKLPTDKAFVAGKLSDVKVTFRTAGLAMVTLTDVERATLAQSAQTNVTPFAQPVVAITNPAGGTTVSGSVSITATGAVAQGTTVRDITLLVDGVVIATGTEGTVTGTWDSSKAPNGSQHTITAVISDAAGNVANSAPVGIIAKNGSCGCGATSGADASAVLALLAMARYMAVRRRRQA